MQVVSSVMITLIPLQSMFSTVEMEAQMLKGQGLTAYGYCLDLVLDCACWSDCFSSGSENEPTMQKRKSSKNVIFSFLLK